MKIFRILLLSLGCTLLNTQAFANEEEATDPASSAVQPGFAYHALDPDIITNYLGDGKTLGYVRVTVELMATDAADLKLLEQHDPLIRDAIIRLIGSKTGAQIKSLRSTNCWSRRRARRRSASSSSPNTCTSNHTGRGPAPLTRCIHCRGRHGSQDAV